jgi:hypothetical protein
MELRLEHLCSTAGHVFLSIFPELTRCSYQRISLVLCAVLATDALAETEAVNLYAQPIEQPKPEYPASERERGREGCLSPFS